MGVGFGCQSDGCRVTQIRSGDKEGLYEKKERGKKRRMKNNDGNKGGQRWQ